MDEFTLMKIHKDTKDKIRKLSDKPKIEIVEKNEIYLLDKDENRIKRICGHLDSDGWPCENDAGNNTLHEGVGRCSLHSHAKAGNVEYLDRLEDVLKDEGDLKKHIYWANRTDEDLFSLDRLARRFDALANYVMSKDNLEGRDIDRAADLLGRIQKLVDTQIKQDKNKIMAAGIALYIKSILQVTQNFIRKEDLPRLVEHISALPIPEELQEIDFTEE